MWHLHLERADGSLFSIRAKALVNAAGPWVAKFIRDDLKMESPYGIRLIQGSHLIVPKLYEGEHAHILQNEDQRIVFTIPYLNHFTLIGTTDREYTGDPAAVAITEGETDYLLKVVNSHFKKRISRDDILHSYSGVRPLCNDESDNPSAVTRDYTLALSGTGEEAPLLSVFGGKLTTYRKLAESALAQLAPYFKDIKPSWTASATLPGGEDMTTPQALCALIRDKFDWVPTEIARRWATTYGSRTWRMLEGVQNLGDMGEHIGGGLYTREVDYLCSEEWATTAHDILWRRSKLGLFTTPEEQQKLADYMSKVEQNRSKIEAA
jgi:glycerol-3-phosphate dehydrogenase